MSCSAKEMEGGGILEVVPAVNWPLMADRPIWFDTVARKADTIRMFEKGIHIVARLAGIPVAGCRDKDRAD